MLKLTVCSWWACIQLAVMFCLLCIAGLKFLMTLVFMFIRDTGYWFVVSGAGLHWPHEDWDMVLFTCWKGLCETFPPHLLVSPHIASFFFSLLCYVFSLGSHYFCSVSPKTFFGGKLSQSSLSETPLFVLIVKRLCWLHIFRILYAPRSPMHLYGFYCFVSVPCSWSRFVVTCVFSAF